MKRNKFPLHDYSLRKSSENEENHFNEEIQFLQKTIKLMKKIR